MVSGEAIDQRGEIVALPELVPIWSQAGCVDAIDHLQKANGQMR